MPWINPDFQCQEYARRLAEGIPQPKQKQAKKLINDCAAVIARQGPCAAILYLKDKARKKKPTDPATTAEGILKDLLPVFKLVDNTPVGPAESSTPATEAETRSRTIANDLGKLLLLRKLLLQFFAYLRHYVGTEG